MSFPTQASVTTPVLEIGYEAAGEPSADGVPVILLHGFPYDVRAFDDVADELAASGRYVLAPYLRGYGPTRFRDAQTRRSGQQAAIGQDLLDFMDALEIDRAVVAGYDWGGRAACIAAALWPERITGLVTCGGYAIQDIARSGEPAPAEIELKLWYQYYFHSERGRRGLTRNRDELCALLWRDWSPTWTASAAATRPPRPACTTRTSSTWRSTPTATATAWPKAIRATSRWRPRSPRYRRSPSPPSSSSARPTA